MSKTVYVVTGLDLGWDCVCVVFEKYEDAVAYCMPEDYDENPDYYEDQLNDEGFLDNYIIHTNTLK